MPARTHLSLALLLCTLTGVAKVHANALDHLATTDDIGLNKVPHEGVSRILVIPTRVGVSEFPQDRLAELKTIFASEGGPGSFRDYWRTVSNGRYDPIPYLADPVLFADSCPIPSKTLDDCTVGLDDIQVLGRGELKVALTEMFERVRSEQGLDFRDFDVNSATGAEADGFFDGVILDTDIYSGIAFPLAAVGNSVSVGARDANDTSQLECGIVGLIPPAFHEFGHVLGFVDHYGGPTLNGLAADAATDLSAFSRQQLGWASIVEAKHNQSITLRPVLDGGPIVRFGEGDKYVLLENRGGALHSQVSETPAGVYWYTVDEQALPFGRLGFLGENDLYLPNAEAPYLNINLPIDCELIGTNRPCALPAGQNMRVVHGSGTDLGFSIELGEPDADGNMTLRIYSDQGNAPGGCSASGPSSSSTPALWLLSLLLLLGRRRRHPATTHC